MSQTIHLANVSERTAFNLERWDEVLADPSLAKLPHRIETDRYGHILMTPPPGFHHSQRQAHIAALLRTLLAGGQPLTECPISTSEGIKAADVAWIASTRSERVERPKVLTTAPEVCIEIVSPGNADAEIEEKRLLYFDSGAQEVWICNLDGSISFFTGPNEPQSPNSPLCPEFPNQID